MGHTWGKALPLEPGLPPTCCVLVGQFLPVSGGQAGTEKPALHTGTVPAATGVWTVAGQPGQASPAGTPTRFGEFFHRAQNPLPIPGCTVPLCRAPPKAGLLRGCVLMPAGRSPWGPIPCLCAQRAYPLHICSWRQRDQGQVWGSDMGPAQTPLPPSPPQRVGGSGQLGHPALVWHFEPVLLAPYQALQDYQSHLPLRQLEFRAFELQMSQVLG